MLCTYPGLMILGTANEGNDLEAMSRSLCEMALYFEQCRVSLLRNGVVVSGSPAPAYGKAFAPVGPPNTTFCVLSRERKATYHHRRGMAGSSGRIG